MILQLEIKDAVFARIQMALSREVNGVRIPATEAEIGRQLLDGLKGAVIEYEAAQAAFRKRDEVGKEDWLPLPANGVN